MTPEEKKHKCPKCGGLLTRGLSAGIGANKNEYLPGGN